MAQHPALTQALADAQRAELAHAARVARAARRDREAAAPFARWLRSRRAAAATVEARPCGEPAGAGC
jgi:hypothetical protein